MKNLEGGVKFLMYLRFVQVFLYKQVEGMSKHKGIYVTPSHTKKIFSNMKREGKGFSGRITPLFQTMMVQVPEDMGEDSAAPTDSHSTPIITQPSLSKPHKKKSKRKQRKDNGPTKPIPDEATNEEPIFTPSCDPPQSGEDRLQLTELMSLCTKIQKQVLDLEEAKTAQAKEIDSLKKIVKQLEKRRKSRTLRLKRLRKVSSASRVESFNVMTLIDETQERYDDEMLFDVQGEEVVAEKEVAEKEVSAADLVTTAGEVVTTASATTTVDELTLAQTLIEIKAAKPKAVTTAATTITTSVASTRPKVKGIVFHDQEKQASAFTPIKDQIALDEELALRLQAEEQAELEKERVAHQEAIIKELDSIQAMIDADEQLDAKLQVKEQEQFSIEEKSRMLVEMIAERKKFFAAQRAAKQRDERVEAEKDDDQEEAEMKRHIKIVKDEVIDKDGRMGYFKLIRADRSLKRYSSMIKMLQDIDREDLETLWKLIKAKHGNTRLEEDYERVLWGNLKVMFEPDIKSEIWRNLQAFTQLQLLSDYDCWKDYADREGIKIDWRTRILTKISDLDNSTSNVLIPLDSWTSGLLVYKLPLSGLRMIQHLSLKNDMTPREKKSLH
ncbi:hypothetical protein Tco_1206583 [Tanacetum coccineum]